MNLPTNKCLFPLGIQADSYLSQYEIAGKGKTELLDPPAVL
jgi:hypothetical protein